MRLAQHVILPTISLPDDELAAEVKRLNRQIRVVQRLELEARRELRRRAHARRVQPDGGSGCGSRRTGKG